MSKNDIINSLKEDIAISNFTQKYRKQEKIKNVAQSVLAITVCTLSITGMVFAKEISAKIYDNFWHTGNGVGKAMDEGYIENTNMDYEVSNTQIENTDTGEKIEDAETKIKVDEIVMDDFTLSLTFNVQLSDKIKEFLEDNVWECNFPDLVIYDENNVVLYAALGTTFNEFCKEKNLEYDYNTVPEGKLINTGVNIFCSERSKDSVKVVYNIYTGGDTFPKSKKLNFEMSQIKISDKDETLLGDEEITLTGDWNFSIDVPEKMYNRSNIVYTQKSTTNDDYKIIAATVRETGTELEFRIKTEKPLEYPYSEKQSFYNTLEEDDELKTNDISTYIFFEHRNSEEYKKYEEHNRSLYDLEAYITNEDGEKYEFTIGPRANGSGRINEEILQYNAMYDLTKYDLTDEITVHINYLGNEEEIILERKEEK